MKNEDGSFEMLLTDYDFGKDLSEFLDKKDSELRRKFKQDLFICKKSGICFEDCRQELITDWLKNMPRDWYGFTDEHKFNLTAKAIKYKGLKIYSKCSYCNKKYDDAGEKDSVTTFKSPYENEILIKVTHFISLAVQRGLLTANEIKVLSLTLEEKNSKEIAAITGETDDNIRKIKSRAVEKLQKVVKSESGDSDYKSL